MAVLITKEAQRCLQCKVPQCQKGCPVNTPIPQIIQMFKENRLMDAGEALFLNNPMSSVCAIVCNHEAQCTGHCVMGRKDSPILFYEIEKYISGTYLDRMKKVPERHSEHSVAVIGSGPAGITAAVILRHHGYDVTMFEEKSKIGGMLQYGIPDFRLSRSILDKYNDLLIQMGVRIRPNSVIGSALNIETLFLDGYEAVFVGTGVWRPKTLGIRGESLSNVHFGISYLSNPSAFHLGRTLSIIGVGNVAMDVARTALRHGVEEVRMYARSKRVSASSEEVEFAKLDGAEIVFGYAVDHITPEGPVFKIAIFDEEGQVAGYEDEMVMMPSDSTIIAASQGPKNKLLLTTEGLEGSDRGLLVVDEYMMTTVPGVFAGGDVVHGSKTVVDAVREAKIAAQGMINYIEKRKYPQ